MAGPTSPIVHLIHDGRLSRFRIVEPAIRFWTKVAFTPSCWLWRGYTRKGYGTFVPRVGQKMPAHRFAYEFCVARIPTGLTLDHLCRVRSCVNPDHLEPVTNRENVLRGVGLTARNAVKTHCLRGHEYTPQNTIQQANGRACRTCDNALRRIRRAGS